MSAPSIRLRLEALAPRIAALGARPVAELLIDLAAATGEPEIVLARAEAFGRLSPAMVRAAGADRFPTRIALVPPAGRAA